MPGRPIRSALALRSCLLTAVEPSRREGSSPTGVVGRRLAHRLVSAGVGVTAVVEPQQRAGWGSGVEVLPGSPERPVEWAAALNGVEAVFLAGAAPRAAPEAGPSSGRPR